MQKVHQNIQKWYSKNGRLDLPWRNTQDSYHIYLSEVMLQQTQVKTVLERYYFPFLESFPTLHSVADAPLDKVLKLWQGLGYYNRAKNLHKTAQITQGVLPETLEALQALPGIGKNTAHALASFAFGQPVPIMEANVKRVLSRMQMLKTPTDIQLWQIAYQQLDLQNAFGYNQAMMDIGATVCKVKTPDCGHCPLAIACKGKAKPEQYPIKKKKQVPTREEIIVMRHCKDKLVLTQRTGNFLHNLWGFKAEDVVPAMADYLGEVHHQYTHFKLSCKVYALAVKTGTATSEFSLDQIHKLAISKVDEKIIALWKKSEVG